MGEVPQPRVGVYFPHPRVPLSVHMGFDAIAWMMVVVVAGTNPCSSGRWGVRGGANGGQAANMMALLGPMLNAFVMIPCPADGSLRYQLPPSR